jgi:hypothetical protein
VFVPAERLSRLLAQLKIKGVPLGGQLAVNSLKL